MLNKESIQSKNVNERSFITDAQSHCETFRKAFVDNCPSMWVKHFDRKKKYLEYQEKIKEGYEPLNEDKKID